MFFHKTIFRQLLGEDQAHAAAKTAEEFIADNGIVVFGVQDIQGNFVEFSSKQKSTDTHVAVLLGCEPMGTLAPLDAPIKTERVTREDHENSWKEIAQRYEKELKQMRNKE